MPSASPCARRRRGVCGDCDDGRASVRPGAPERCTNGRDDDCDGQVDGQDPSCRVPCADADGDGWAVCSGSCILASGVACGDCDDTRSAVHPDHAESCNGRDDDCDGAADEANAGGGGSCTTGETGICAPGTLVCRSGSLDCEGNVSPRPEECANGADDDCNGFADGEDLACSEACQQQPVADADGDAVPDCRDNCLGAPNSLQQDFDRDGMGDACESGVRLCDIDRSGRVDGLDLAALGRSFGLACSDAGFDRGADLTRNCQVDGEDLALLAALFGGS